VLTLDVGGLERNILNQVRVAGEFGQRMSVVCLERPGTLAPRVEEAGGRVVCLDKPPGFRPGLVGPLARLLRGLGPDVVHTHQLATLFYGGVAARLAGAPLVVHTEHGREAYARGPRARLLGRAGGLCVARFYCLTADMASEVVARRVVPRRKVRVIQNGIDTDHFRGSTGDREALRRSLGIPPGATVIGTVGRVTEIKQQDLLIRALAAVRRALPEAHLLVVGDGPLMGKLRALAAELGLSGCVHLAGYQPETSPYLQAMDVFALTSRSEGMPQAVLEASVTGLPVVATRVGGLPEVIDDGTTGLLIEPGDEAGLASALLGIAADPDRARRLGAAGRARVGSLFDIRRMVGDYHRDYLELLNDLA
jgi:sugar transferase (PEP-CTERM/EpsH1 system associated)